MRDPDALWQRPLDGRRPWPWHWPHLVRSATRERIGSLAQALATLPTAGQRLAAGEALLRLLVESGHRPLAANDETIGWLVAALMPPDWPWTELDQQAGARQAAEDLLQVLAPESHVALRRLLSAPAPPLPFSRLDWRRLRLADL